MMAGDKELLDILGKLTEFQEERLLSFVSEAYNEDHLEAGRMRRENVSKVEWQED